MHYFINLDQTKKNKLIIKQIMTMISQSSFISSSSQQQTIINSLNLQKIERDVFNRIVNLKNKKIQLLQYLSQCIDKRYRIEKQLVQQLQIYNKKQQKLVNREEYQPIILKNVYLSTEIQELQRQIQQKTNNKKQNISKKQKELGQRSRTKSAYSLSKQKQIYKSSHSINKFKLQNSKSQQPSLHHSTNSHNQQQQYQIIDQILQQRKFNNQLIQILQQKNISQYIIPIQQQIAIIKHKQQIISQVLNAEQDCQYKQKLSKSIRQISQPRHIEQDISIKPVTLHLPQTPQPIQKIQVKQLLKYIQEEQNEKNLLYRQLLQFKNQMQQIKQQNYKMLQNLKQLHTE